MIRKDFYITIFALGALMASCRPLTDHFADRELASVGEKSLLVSDVKPLLSDGITKEDSAKIVSAYVDMWVKKQLKIEEAERVLQSPEMADIQRMVDDYRASLLNFKLEQHFVDTRMDTTITAGQIREYYNSHRNDFVLDRAMVRGLVVRMGERFRQKRYIKELMTSTNADRQGDLRDMVLKNDLKIWDYPTLVESTEFFSNLPASRVRDTQGLLVAKGVVEIASGDNVYMVYLREVLQPGDFAPISSGSVADMIRKVLVSQRRMEIIRQSEDSLYNIAKSQDKIKITK